MLLNPLCFRNCIKLTANLYERVQRNVTRFEYFSFKKIKVSLLLYTFFVQIKQSSYLCAEIFFECWLIQRTKTARQSKYETDIKICFLIFRTFRIMFLVTRTFMLDWFKFDYFSNYWIIMLVHLISLHTLFAINVCIFEFLKSIYWKSRRLIK